MPSSQVHCAGGVVPSGSNASSMPVESNSLPKEKIVSFGAVPVTRPGGGLRAVGGGLKALTLLQQKKGVMWK